MKKFALLFAPFFLISFLFIFTPSHTFAASCTPRTYTECEEGNPTFCLSHGVPKQNVAQVTVHSNCTYTCVNVGPCASSSSSKSSSSSSSPTSSSSSTSSVPQGDSFVSLVVALPGIGGLHGGNPNPGSPTRSVTLSLYTPDQDPSNVNDKPILVNSTMHLDTTSGDQTFGYFINPKIDVGALNGDFQIFVKTNQDLRAQIIPSGNSSSDNTFHLTSGQVTNLPQVALLAGDIFPQPTSNSTSFGDNTIDISDYNMLISCYGGNANTSTCPSKSAADLNDDGVVDGIDYNILLRSFFTLQNQ